MQAVSKIPSKCSFSPPLTLVSAVLSASGHPQKYVAIGPAQCRHRPAGGQPFRDVAARTAGAEHPTFVIVGCDACILFRHINKFYHVYKKVNIINKEKRMRYMLL